MISLESKNWTFPVSVVLPVYNEIRVIEKVSATWLQVLESLPKGSCIEFEDAKSNDGTAEFLQNLANQDPRVIFHQSSVKDGFSQAIARLLTVATNEWIFVADSDGQYAAEDIFYFLSKWNPETKFIKGVKINRQDGFFRRFFSYLMNRFIVVYLGLPFLDYNSSHYLIKKETAKEISQGGWTFSYSINVEITLRTILSNNTYQIVYVKHTKRSDGFSRGNPPLKFLGYGLRGIKDVLALKRNF